ASLFLRAIVLCFFQLAVSASSEYRRKQLRCGRGERTHESSRVKISDNGIRTRCTADYNRGLRGGTQARRGGENGREAGGVCQHAHGERHFVAGGVQEEVPFHRDLPLPSEHTDTAPKNSARSAHTAA